MASLDDILQIVAEKGVAHPLTGHSFIQTNGFAAFRVVVTGELCSVCNEAITNINVVCICVRCSKLVHRRCACVVTAGHCILETSQEAAAAAAAATMSARESNSRLSPSRLRLAFLGDVLQSVFQRLSVGKARHVSSPDADDANSISIWQKAALSLVRSYSPTAILLLPEDDGIQEHIRNEMQNPKTLSGLGVIKLTALYLTEVESETPEREKLSLARDCLDAVLSVLLSSIDATVLDNMEEQTLIRIIETCDSCCLEFIHVRVMASCRRVSGSVVVDVAKVQDSVRAERKGFDVDLVALHAQYLFTKISPSEKNMCLINIVRALSSDMSADVDTLLARVHFLILHSSAGKDNVTSTDELRKWYSEVLYIKNLKHEFVSDSGEEAWSLNLIESALLYFFDVM